MKEYTVRCNLCLKTFALDIKANETHLKDYHKVTCGITKAPNAFFTINEIYDGYDIAVLLDAMPK